MHSEEKPNSTNAVVDMSRSPYAALRPVALSAVRLEDAFWTPRITINRERTLPQQLQQCEETGRIDNFRRAAGKIQGDFQGIFFNDSDVYKWLEAASYSLATHPDPKLDADVDNVIQEVADAQQSDGYLNTYFMFDKAGERFTNLKDMHELYCAGHLIQAAVAHFRATGKRTLLDVAIRLADCLDRTFGDEPGKRPGTCGHEEAEMALVELYRATTEPRYLHLARYMIDVRGHKPGIVGGDKYHQDHVPFGELQEVTGHAVRQMYLDCGVADVSAEANIPSYRDALTAQWDNFTEKRMYVTGGAGARYEGEAFGVDYELPNERAYAETCAAIGSVMWNWRMLNLTGESKYADVLETALYNGVLSGLSLDGTHYFYQNPLADRGKHRRQEWFGCACCPPNIARLLASLPGYFYSVTDASIYVHLYATGTATLTTPNGGQVTLTQTTQYPFDGVVEIRVEESNGLVGSLYLRIPWWADGAQLTKNGAPDPVAEDLKPGCYAEIIVSQGDVIRLTLPMNIARTESHPHVTGNRGRVALQRGPLVYCLEAADHDGADIWAISLPHDVELRAEHVPDLLGGVTILRGGGQLADTSEWDGALYAPAHSASKTLTRPVSLTAIPYYAWANREPGPMQVWIPVE